MAGYYGTMGQGAGQPMPGQMQQAQPALSPQIAQFLQALAARQNVGLGGQGNTGAPIPQGQSQPPFQAPPQSMGTGAPMMGGQLPLSAGQPGGMAGTQPSPMAPPQGQPSPQMIAQILQALQGARGGMGTGQPMLGGQISGQSAQPQMGTSLAQLLASARAQ